MHDVVERVDELELSLLRSPQPPLWQRVCIVILFEGGLAGVCRLAIFELKRSKQITTATRLALLVRTVTMRTTSRLTWKLARTPQNRGEQNEQKLQRQHRMYMSMRSPLALF
jgi:hypothetical protein